MAEDTVGVVLMSLFLLNQQDTAGSERYEAMSRIYYRGARAAIVCYDLTDRTSFERTRFWVNELKMNEEVDIYIVSRFEHLNSLNTKYSDTCTIKSMAMCSQSLFACIMCISWCFV